MHKVLGISALEEDDFFPFGKQTFFFEEMICSADIDFDVLFFSPLKWNKNATKIDGYIFKNKTWLQVSETLPEIIYDRIFLKSEINKEQIEEFRTFVKLKNFAVLNPIELATILDNKLLFHNFLDSNEFPTIETFQLEFLHSEKFIKRIKNNTLFFLKPIAGSGAKGIYVLTFQTNSYVVTNADNQKLAEFNTIAELLDYIDSILFQNEYFLQPNAHIIDFNGCPIDIRVLVQNFGKHDYRISGMGARIGPKNSYVSNLNSGGSALPIEALTEYYKLNFNIDINVEIATISAMCINCCKLLDLQMGKFLEIGFDVLLTTDKGPVILEGNAKPSRWIFKLLSESYSHEPKKAEKYKQIRTQSIRNVLHYTTNNFFNNKI